VHRLLDHLDTAEMGAVEVTQEGIVIAGDIDDANAAVRSAQQNLHDLIMRGRPVPFGSQAPAVDNVADQVDGFGLVVTEKVDKPLALTPTTAEMHVRQKQRAIPARPSWQPVVVYLKAESHAPTLTKSCLKFVTPGLPAPARPLTGHQLDWIPRFWPVFAAC
jgi:hypothetical protein